MSSEVKMMLQTSQSVCNKPPGLKLQWNSRQHWFLWPILSLWLFLGVSMPIPVIGLHNEDKVFVNGSCVLNEERFVLIGSFVAFFIPLVIMVVTYCLTIQVSWSVCASRHVLTLPFLLFITLTSTIILAPFHPQVLQRQATVFLYEAKTSSQQPLHTPAMTNTLQPPASTFHLPQINTLSPSESQGKTRSGSLAAEMWFISTELFCKWRTETTSVVRFHPSVVLYVGTLSCFPCLEILIPQQTSKIH